MTARLALEIVGVVGARVGRALDRLRGVARAGDPVIVATVYDPGDGTSQAWRAGLPPWPDVAAVLVELNDALKAVDTGGAPHTEALAVSREAALAHVAVAD